jgi:hypothetical protein
MPTINLDLSGPIFPRIAGERSTRQVAVDQAWEQCGSCGIANVTLNLDGARYGSYGGEGMEAWRVSLNNQSISDLTPRYGVLAFLNATMPDQSISPVYRLRSSRYAQKSKVTSLGSLQECDWRLVVAGCASWRILNPQGRSLQQLDLSRTSVSDLRPIADCPFAN